MVLDDGYRELQLKATQLCPWLQNSNSIEGYDYGGPGLIFEMLQEDSHFGSEVVWSWEEI